MRRLLMAGLFSLLLAGLANAQAHHTNLTWTLSTDDTTTSCAAPNTCSQNIYRAPGACSTTSTFTLLSNISSTAVTYIDNTVTPGVWCYGVTFVENGLESAKDTFAVSLPPAPPTGGAGSAT